MAKQVAQFIVLTGQIIGRAFARALRQELLASQAAANTGGKNSRVQAETNVKLGISLDEAAKILNVSTKDSPDRLNEAYRHLFEANEKSNWGGSFYLQSKIVRAKERLEQEWKVNEEREPKNEKQSSSPKT